MEDLQFIIESPQYSQGHKKRPRLVTSCDNCRLKKIKCIQPSPEGAKCEACKTAKIPCRFKDRERYFAERSRNPIGGLDLTSTFNHAQSQGEFTPAFDSYSSASPSTSSSSPISNPRSSSLSPSPRGEFCAEGDPVGRYESYPPERHRHDQMMYACDNSQRSCNPNHSLPRPYPHSPRTLYLFDPEQPQRPNPALMPHFIQLFFEQMGNEFAFVSYEETMSQFFGKTLSPVLSNCIAALAARYSTLPELNLRGSQTVIESYGDNAKTVLSSVAHLPALETLHALILMCYLEYKSNRIAGFRLYSQMAMRMGINLGLPDESMIAIHLSERELIRRRTTWSSVVQLHLSASAFSS